jgi:hypothetical protein
MGSNAEGKKVHRFLGKGEKLRSKETTSPLYRRESNLAISSSPVTNNNEVYLLGVLVPCKKLKNF